jgi:ABC-type oligopeptide transport system ATPase subunit
MRDFYKILIVGSSGKGKSFTFRTLNPKTTGFINAENKPLPFKNDFEHETKCTTLSHVKKALKEYAEDTKIETIVFDSLSSYMDMLLKEARDTKKGFDIWNHYNEEIGKLLHFIKSIQKEIFITAHYEWVQDEGGAKERRAKVKGKEWEGTVEKEFTMVLYAGSKFNHSTKKPEYFLNLYEEDSSAKCPPGIFDIDTLSIPNDGQFIINKILDFVKK